MDQPADHPRILTGKIGVLLVNLGTPDAPTAAAVRRRMRASASIRSVSASTVIGAPSAVPAALAAHCGAGR